MRGIFMITIQPTEYLTGAHISADYWDFNALIEAIYALTGDENRYYDYQGSRKRLLGTCLKLRQASKGEHAVELIANGIHKGISRKRQQLYQEKNIYFGVDILLPELIFTALALNDFIVLYKETVDDSEWNIPVSIVRQFQAQIASCIEPFMTEEHFLVFLATLHAKSPLFFRYATQYVDMLNIEYLALSKEKRAEQITTYALRLVFEDDTYELLKQELFSVTSFSKQALHEIPLTLKYPESIIW